jgi:hypothetical protein
MSKGADTILYNLAFSPKISHIDFTDSALQSQETAEAIFKLVKISGSLETLILRNTYINGYLKEEFYNALGENKTLNYLNLDSNTSMSLTNLSSLAKACAMNNKKNGCLKYLSLEKCFSSYNDLKYFLNAF